jgi:ABC-type molybdenum transport system ATPase subunit/photorepair protein PhrA
VSKKAPGGKDILKDVYLSFYPGAKIGVVGLNGSGVCLAVTGTSLAPVPPTSHDPLLTGTAPLKPAWRLIA